MSLLLITILNSSICLDRLAIFKLAILKPLTFGINESLELVLVDTSFSSFPIYLGYVRKIRTMIKVETCLFEEVLVRCVHIYTMAKILLW